MSDGLWDVYRCRYGSYGSNRRDAALAKTRGYIANKAVDSLSYHTAYFGPEFSIKQNVVIINTEELNKKQILSLPGETIENGSIFKWANHVWLVTETDANDEVYTRGTMQQCNYILNWIDDSGNKISKWCIVEDGTKYLIGERTMDMMSIGDARFALTIGKDKDTQKLKRGMRFLIDDPDAEATSAFEITKPNRLFNIFDGKGVYRFILNEVNTTDNDSQEEQIADVYNRIEVPVIDPEENVTDRGKGVWL